MIKPTKQKKARKGKIKISATSHLTQKNDNTRVARRDMLMKAPFIMNDNGLNMRIKIKRKSR